ncbi:MAG: hypothetical protein ACJAR4_002220, partial [Psychroserpens sp.]
RLIIMVHSLSPGIVNNEYAPAFTRVPPNFMSTNKTTSVGLLAPVRHTLSF